MYVRPLQSKPAFFLIFETLLKRVFGIANISYFDFSFIPSILATRDYWALVSIPEPYTHAWSTVMTLFSKSGLSLNVVNISSALFLLKILQFWNIHKNGLAWAERYVNVISNLSNSDSTIIQKHFLHCFHRLLTWTVIDISALLKPLLPQLNLPNATVNILKVLAHWISFFTQN